MTGLIRFSIVAMFLFSTSGLFGGVKIITESIDHTNNDKSVAVLLIDGDKVVMETVGADAQAVIYDLVKKEVTIVNHKDKSWMKMTKKQIDDSRAYMKKQIQAAIEQQKATLAQLSPEQRAQVETQMQTMLGEKDKVPVKYVNTGKKGKWDTKECSIFDGMIDKIKVEEICTVPQEKLPCSSSELEKLKQISVDYGPEGDVEAAWKDIKATGIPVITKYFQAGKLVTTNVFATFDKVVVPADKFVVPAGYKMVAAPFDAKPAQ